MNNNLKKTDYRSLVLEISKRGYAEKLFAGTSGNISAYDRDSGLIYITPSGLGYETMETRDIVIIDIDGQIIEGPHCPSSEWRLHTTIYKERPDACAVVHTHSPYATAFAVAAVPIPVILIEMIPFIGGSVEVARYAMPGSASVGTEALEALNGKLGCLLQNHGVVAIGKDPESAYRTAVYIEDAAKICTLASAIGTPCVIPEDKAEAYRKSL